MRQCVKGLGSGLALALAGWVVLVIFPACSVVLDGSDLTRECDQFDGRVRVSNASGTQTLTTADADFVRNLRLAGCAVTRGGTAEQRQTDALARWNSFIPGRLDEICAGDTSTDLYRRLCPGTWCYAELPSISGEPRRLTDDEEATIIPLASPTPAPLLMCGATAVVDVPPELPFGDVPVRQPPTAGPTQSFDVRNGATGLLSFRSVDLDRAIGDAGLFSVGGDCVPTLMEEISQGLVLLGDGGRPSCRVDVTFSPTDPGAKTGRLNVLGVDGGVLAQVNLSGNALPGALSLLPAGRIAFSGVACDPDGYRRVSVTLQNAGPGDVRLDALGPTESVPPGNWFRVEPAASFWLPPSSQALTIRACRAGAAASATQLRVQSNGTPTDFMVDITPAAFACPVVPAVCP
jgi:hypothetical protein